MLFSKFCNTALKLKQFPHHLYRCYATIIEKELEVPMFCDLHVEVPYNLTVKPLNVHKYHNCDKLILKIDKRTQDSLKYDLNGNQITITDEHHKYNDFEDIELSIKAPVKANLYINCQKNIKVGYFHGDKLYLKASNGNINIDKYQGDVVRLITHNGEINIKEHMLASDIDAVVINKGNISARRLQSMNVKLQINHGNISVKSSYSHESHFSTFKGDIELNNVHKSCKIFIEEGNLNLTGFDGKLKTVVDNGSANIQLSRISDNSEINILKGSLILKLAEACQDYTEFQIKTLDWGIPENFKMAVRNCDDVIHLIPEINEENTVQVNCLEGSVDIDSASWQDMIMMKLKNNTQ